MPRFAKASAKAAAVAAPGAQPKSLVDVLNQEPIPVSPQDVVGRVVWVFATQARYPQCKFALRSEAEGESEPMECLVTCNSIPHRVPQVDDVLIVRSAEVRPAFERPGIGIAERCMLPNLATKELSLNFNAGKRKRSAVEHLGCMRMCVFHVVGGKLYSYKQSSRFS